MKKIKLVTFHSAVNQGTIIQAYALQKTLEGIGFDVEIVDYRPPFMRNDYLRFEGDLKAYGKKLLQYLIFYLFIKKHLKLTKKLYRKYQDFIDHPIEADYVVCGSDQIWNLRITKSLDPIYLLDFPVMDAKKIAYAVSMGETEVPAPLMEKFKNAVLKIGWVSVRERFTQDQLSACGYKGPMPIVIDPTLLPIEFPVFASEKGFSPPYIALYYIAGDEEIGKAALKLKKILNLPIVNISSSRFKGADKNELFLNPGQWLNKIKEASIVCTNSFHGTALSVKFNVAFYVINARKEVGWPGNRMSELLSSLGLEHRIINTSQEIPESRAEILEGADFNKAMELLRERQIYSLEFLEQSLSSNVRQTVEMEMGARLSS